MKCIDLVPKDKGALYISPEYYQWRNSFLHFLDDKVFLITLSQWSIQSDLTGPLNNKSLDKVASGGETNSATNLFIIMTLAYYLNGHDRWDSGCLLILII